MSIYPILMATKQALLRRAGDDRLPLMFCTDHDNVVTWQELELQQPGEDGDYPNGLLKIIDHAAGCLTFYVNSVPGGVGSGDDPGDGSAANPWHDPNTALKHNYYRILPGECCNIKLRIKIAGTIDYPITARGVSVDNFGKSLIIEPWDSPRATIGSRVLRYGGIIYKNIDFVGMMEYPKSVLDECDDSILNDCTVTPYDPNDDDLWGLYYCHRAQLIRCELAGRQPIAYTRIVKLKQCNLPDMTIGNVIEYLDDCDLNEGCSSSVCINSRIQSKIIQGPSPNINIPAGFQGGTFINCTVDFELIFNFSNSYGTHYPHASVSGFYADKAIGCTSKIRLTANGDNQHAFAQAEAFGFEVSKDGVYIDCHADVVASGDYSSFACGFHKVRQEDLNTSFQGCTTSPRICINKNCDDDYYQCADITDTPAANGIPLPYLAAYNRLSEDLRS